MKTITLNIGLNVSSTEPASQLDLTLKRIFSGSFIRILPSNIKIDSGQYDGMVERTLVINALTGETQTRLHNQLSTLSMTLGQDCIAYKYDGVGYIAFAHDYNAPTFEFNDDYFID